jgi:protein-S-isoprenylcysteine O-methyltransferase Ste14
MTMLGSAIVGVRDSLDARFKAFEATKLYDLIAATPLIAWYGFCLSHQIPATVALIAETDIASADARFFANVASKLATLVFFTVIVLLLVLRHKPRGKSSGFYPRFAAVAGTYLSVAMVLLPAKELSVALYAVSTVLILAGTLLSIYSALSLGRSLSMLPEARRLITRGPYGVIRHPLYLSEAIALLGLTLQYSSVWAVALFTLQCVFQIERMKNEERVLTRIFPEYQDYMACRARLIPGVY